MTTWLVMWDCVTQSINNIVQLEQVVERVWGRGVDE